MKLPKLNDAYIGILSVLLLVSLPLILYSLVMDHRLFTARRGEVSAALEAEASLMSERFDEELDRLNSTALSIQNSRLIRMFNYDSRYATVGNKRMIIADLFDYNQTNTFLSDVFLCLKDNRIVYSTTGLYSLDSLIPDVLQYPAWSKADFVYDVNTVERVSWRQSENIRGRGPTVTMLYPLPQHNPNSYAVLLFLISEQSIHRTVLRSVPEDSSVSIWSDRDQLIYTSNSALPFPALAESASTAGKALPSYRDANGETYYYSLVKSPRSGFSCYCAVPRETLLGEMSYLHSPLLWWGVLRSLAFLAAALALAFILYRPWKRLAAGVSGQNEAAPVYRGINYLRFISNMSALSDSMFLHMEQTREPVRQMLLSEALCGRGESDLAASFPALHESLFHRRYYLPIVIVLSGEGRSRMRLPETHTWVLPEYDAILPESCTPNTFLLLLGSDNLPEQAIEADLRTMREMLSVLLSGRHVCFGAGKSTEPEGMAGAISLAYDVLRYRVLYGGNAILLSEQCVAAEQPPQFYPHAMIGDLESAVMSCDRGKMEAAASSLEGLLRSAHYSPEMTLCILGDIYGRLLKACFTTLGKDWAKQDDTGLYHRLSKSFSLTELHEICLLAAETLLTKEDVSENRSFTITTLYQYLEENYCDYTFSVQGMAAHFEVSTSHLSYFFKKAAGTTVLDYVNNKRLDRAMQLLVSTDLSIKDVVSSIGFSDTSTFIKKFKKHCGMTPGRYKEQFC
jgi:AraC-like DNA-binding protein